MKYISLKGNELDKINFIPTLIICFYIPTSKEFKKEYDFLHKKFPKCNIIGCSAESVIENDIPYVDLNNINDTVYMCLDINIKGYSIHLCPEDKSIVYNSNIEQDILIFSSFSSPKLEREIEKLSASNSVYKIAGAVAGVNMNDIKPTIFINGKFYSDYCLYILVDRNYYFLSTCSINLYTPVGLPMKITRAKSNIVLELDGEPALEVIESLVGKLDDFIVEKFGYPMFLSNKLDTDWSDKPLASLVSINRDDSSIVLYREVVEGEYIKPGIMLGKEEQIDRLNIWYENICDNSPGLMLFCISIPGNLGILEYQYLYHLKKTRDVKFVGFHSFGEIGPANINQKEFVLHNETMTMAFICEQER